MSPRPVLDCYCVSEASLGSLDDISKVWCMWLSIFHSVRRNTGVICDVIKQNESEVGQIRFSFLWLIVYIIYKATFYNRPHWNWSIGSKDMCRWRVAKTILNKQIICFVSLYLKISTNSDSCCLITSHMWHKFKNGDSNIWHGNYFSMANSNGFSAIFVNLFVKVQSSYYIM